MKQLFLVLITCLITSLAAREAQPPEFTPEIADSDPIIVSLPTESLYLPLYIAQIQNAPSSPYAAELLKILRFDLDNNGITEAAAEDQEMEKKASAALRAPRKMQSLFAKSPYWGIAIPAIEEDKFSLLIYTTSNGAIHEIKGLILKGQIETDRRGLHQIADAFAAKHFGKAPLATTQILYTLRHINENGEFTSEVWQADFDGGNPKQITANGGYCVTPHVVNGEKELSFLYVSYKKAQPRIFFAVPVKGRSEPLSALRGNQLMPVISSQHDKVAFISDITGNPDLFIQPFSLEQGAIGQPQQIFAARQATQGSPTFSPDGKEIAFVSNKDGSPKIYRMEIPAPGTNIKKLRPKLVSIKAKNGTAPAWSPDGSKIAFCSRTAGYRQIWIRDLLTGEEYPITDSKGHKENPSWAQDSRHLVYNTADPGYCELFLIDSVKKKPVKLTSGTGEKRFPSWIFSNQL